MLLLYLHFILLSSFSCCSSFYFWSSFCFHLLMFFIRISFSTSSLTLPWTIAGFLHPFYTFSNASVIIFFKSQKLPAIVLCLGEPPRRFLWCCCCMFISFLYLHFFFISFLYLDFVVVLHFIFDLHFVVICQCSSFTFTFRHHPSHFRGLSPGFYTHFILSVHPIAEWFATLSFFNHSVIFLPQALRFWVDVFYPQAFF